MMFKTRWDKARIQNHHHDANKTKRFDKNESDGLEAAPDQWKNAVVESKFMFTIQQQRAPQFKITWHTEQFVTIHMFPVVWKMYDYISERAAVL